jgi:hypothetical protein
MTTKKDPAYGPTLIEEKIRYIKTKSKSTISAKAYANMKKRIS